MRKSFARRIPGILITLFLAAAMALFLIGIEQTKFLPTKLLLLAGGIMALLLVIIGLLARDVRRTGSMILGIFLTVAVLVGITAGTYYVSNAVNALNDLTQVKVEITDMGVYVRLEDPAQDLADAVGYRFGIQESLDRESTDKAIRELEEELGTKLDITGFAGLEELVDALLVTRQVDAILLNSAYLDLLEEMEGYEQTQTKMRELHSRQVQTEIQIEVKPTEPEAEGEQPSNTFIAYISGIDSRKGLTARSRSDVNILAVVNPDTHQVLLVSTPRDFYVPLPISNGKPDKLTHAGIYGIDVSVGTLEMLYGVDIDYYFRVNFSGFEKIVDALGGITVHSDYAFTTTHGKHTIREGENQLNGAEALGFARERYAFASGDRQRGKNQMAVIQAVIDKATSPAILTGFSQLMESVSGCFETSMPYDKIAELVREQLDNGGSWNIVSYSVDGTGASKKPYSQSTNAYVMVPKQETVDKAKEKIAKVLNGEILE